jgi:hypothetical protein
MFSGSRKGQGQIQTLLVALLMVLFLIIPSANFMGALNTEYGFDNSSMSDVMVASDNLYDHTYQLQNSTEQIEEDPTSFIMSGFTGVAAIILDTVDFVDALATAIISLTGFNFGWANGIIFLIVLITLIFAVLNFLRGGGSSL